MVQTKINIGVYLKTLDAKTPNRQRFQEAVLEGLRRLGSSQFHFVVFSEAIPPEFEDGPQISYVALARATQGEDFARRWKLLVGGIARRVLRMIGAGSSPSYRRVTEWLAYEPPYFQQLRDRKIRLIWNLSIDVMHSFVPFIIVVWDLNYWIHPMFPESKVHELYLQHEQHASLVRRASYVIVGTEQGKREVAEMLSVYPPKIRIVPFPTPTLPPRSEKRQKIARPSYVFYPARFWPHKNHVVILHALKLLRDRWGIVLHCVFSGLDEGNLDYVMRVADELDVRKQIEYVGNVSTEEIADLYRDALALVYSNAVGPDNLPPLEAMSVGCPVITADVPGARDQCGDAAMFFERTNERQLAESIKRLLDDANLRRTLTEKGLQRAARWTPLDYANSVLKILDEFALVARMWERSDFKPT